MTLPGIPFEQAAGDGGHRPRTQVVIIHATDNTASAESEADYATHRPDQTSAHLYVDGNSAVQAVRLDHIAFGALYNGNEIGIQFELCGLSNRISDATMREAAPLVAEVCRRYDIPIRKISASQVRNGVRGICGHADITKAFPQDHGDHTDPGASFPWSRFIGYVKQGDLEDDMPIRTSLGHGQDQELPWGEHVVLKWSKEYTDPRGAHEDGNYPGYVAPVSSYTDGLAAIRISGLQPGDPYQVRIIVHDWKGDHATSTSTEVIADATASSGDQYVNAPLSVHLTHGQHLYLEVTVWPATETPTRPAPKVVGGTWRLRQDPA
ncbi:MAG: peptidoglycan recognition family protein [Actinocatenispora sp.]